MPPIRDGVIKPLARRRLPEYFGAACDRSKLVSVRVPILGKVAFHRRVAPALVAVMKVIEAAGLGHLIDRADFGGTYCCRRTRGSASYSPHSWGIAIDLNVHHLLIGGAEVRSSRWNFHCKPSEIAPSLRQLAPYFNAWGFSWGGHWNVKYLDPMHFEATELTVQKLADGQVGEERPLLLQMADSDKACPMRMEGDRAVVEVRDLEKLGFQVRAEHLKTHGKIYLVRKG